MSRTLKIRLHSSFWSVSIAGILSIMVILWATPDIIGQKSEPTGGFSENGSQPSAAVVAGGISVMTPSTIFRSEAIMITEDIEHKIGISQTLCSVQSKEAERQELQSKYDQFLASGKQVDVIPPSEYGDGRISFNHQGPINPAKKVPRWDNDQIANR